MTKKLAVPNMAYNVRAAGISIVTIIIKAMILQQSYNHQSYMQENCNKNMVGSDKRSSLFFRGSNNDKIDSPKYGL